jgi:hypothetical protein
MGRNSYMSKLLLLIVEVVTASVKIVPELVQQE